MKHLDSSTYSEQLPSHSNRPSNRFRYFRSSDCMIFSTLILLAFCCGYSEGKPDSDSDEFWKNKFSNFDHTDLEKDKETMDQIISIIIGVTVFIIVAIFCFILCLCCPLCLLSKMRGRRRGVVYRSVTANGTTVTTAQHRQGTTITVSGPRGGQIAQAPMTGSSTNPSVIAISNNANQSNKPYPVQQSVTVVPVVSPQHPPHMPPQGYSQQQQYPYNNMPQNTGQGQPSSQSNNSYPSDLPPPYPGLSREMDSSNLPYNPYFSEDGPPASAPHYKQ